MDDSAPVPLELLERRITELAAHIHAAMCSWLELVAEYDAREGWVEWGCRSCSEWVSWRCGVAPVAAREHVRVARRLRELPEIRGAFGRGELSYSKVRALTRVKEVADEGRLLELARHATAAQLERIVRGYCAVVAAERLAEDPGTQQRYLSWSYDDDGSLLLRARLPPEEGAVLVRAIEAARDAERSATDAPFSPASAEVAVPSGGERNADALLAMADSLLVHGAAERTGGDRYQVVVHVDAATLAAGNSGVGEPRCELEDGPPIAATTARRLACDAGIVHLVEGDAGPLALGRKTRSIPPALRRALRARQPRCAFPGCERHRYLDAHHVHHWANGGRTDLENLVHLCRRHHRLLHEGRFSTRRDPDGTLRFHRPDGQTVLPVPAQPRGERYALRRRHAQAGIAIGPDSCRALDEGASFDLRSAVDVLLAAAPPG